MAVQMVTQHGHVGVDYTSAAAAHVTQLLPAERIS